MRIAPSLWITLLLLTGCGDRGDIANSPVAGEWHRFENAVGHRNYLLQVPATAKNNAGAPVPLVVYLHGCGRPVETAAASTGWSELARQQGFAVVYPEQTDSGCWTWSDAGHQHRDAGEPSIIAGITQQVMTQIQVDPARVFIIGTSAGGYMANIMGVSYPEVYAAIGILAAGPYGLGSNSVPDVSGRLSFEEMGSRARVMPAFIAQSSTDQLNPAAAAELAVQQWLGLADHADDGSLNGSVLRTPASEETRLAEQPPEPGSGDACVSNAPNLCPGGVIGFQHHYPCTVMHYLDASGESLIDFWLVNGRMHTYASGDDPNGPNLATAAYAFFLKHPQNGAGLGPG